MYNPRSVIPELEAIGQQLYEARAQYMLDTNQGLTKTYNALKNPGCDEARILELRRLHEEMDRAVLDAYGWGDIAVPPYCPRDEEEKGLVGVFEDEVIDRLYLLNGERAREEQRLGKSGGTAKAKGGGKSKGRATSVQSVTDGDDGSGSGLLAANGRAKRCLLGPVGRGVCSERWGFGDRYDRFKFWQPQATADVNVGYLRYYTRVDARNRLQVIHFRRRADTFYETARDLVTLEAQKYWPSVGLLAVHSCIAYADAVLVATNCKPKKPDDHNEAARALRSCCSRTRRPESGIKHFEWLLSKKNKFSYGAEPVREDELQRAKTKMDQVFAWVSSTFPDVAQLQGDQANA